jgi:hypothetical protein
MTGLDVCSPEHSICVRPCSRQLRLTNLMKSACARLDIAQPLSTYSGVIRGPLRHHQLNCLISCPCLEAGRDRAYLPTTVTTDGSGPLKAGAPSCFS